ncbi:MAG: type III pantothenate kinase [Bacteroidia bacterium]
MHTLAIDIGNTQAKLGLFLNNKLIHIYTFSTLEPKLLDEILERFNIKSAILSNVGSNNTYKSYLLNKINLLCLNQNTPVPFANLYQTPQTLGVDRMALTAAAVTMFKNQNTLVIDCGTCVTYDFVDEENNYYGGAISPGLMMRLKAMNEFTAKLPLVTFTQPGSFIGQNTGDCMLSGAFFGLINEIDGFINQYLAIYSNLQVVITGGDGSVLAKHLKNNIFAHENFLLHGLNSILEYNV